MKNLLWYRNGFFKLYEDGKIQKPDGYISDGESWEWLGLVKKLPFGRTSGLIHRKDSLNIPREDLKYKNGKYKYMVVDRDHGTIRLWVQ